MEWSYDGVLYDSGLRGNTDEGHICPLCDCLEDIRVGNTVKGWCATNNSYGLRQGDFHRPGTQRVLFHEACRQCPDTPEDQFCARCKHMRLRHLIQCLLLNQSDSDIEKRALHGWIPKRLDKIDLNLGFVQELDERSHYCDTCHMFAGAAREVMEQAKLPSDSQCHLSVFRDGYIHGPSTIGGVKCSFGMTLSLASSQERLKDDTSLSRGMLNNRLIERKRFLGTIEPSYGHYLVSTPIPTQTVDWRKVSEWVRDCHYSAEHKDSCQAKPTAPEITGLRVIDTKKRCIKSAPVACQYAALSYVWGPTNSHLQATTENIGHLAKEGSLNSDSLPQTIDDAIVACKKMGIDYLWVDRLCILQDDDPERKAYWLNSMGDIYAQSYVTIIALAGNNADHGLPGVNKVKRPASWVGTTQGIYFSTAPLNYRKCLRDSKWATRGWTFQEATLSTRRLLFSDRRAFYECCYPEAIQDELYGSLPDLKRAGIPLSYYERVVMEFTRRDLSWESDVLRAFAGVLHRRWGPECYYGLPLKFFNDAIIWTAVDQSYPTRRADPGDAFPTWSWSSIKGPINMETPYKSIRSGRLRISLAIWAIPSRLSQRPALHAVANTTGKPERLEEPGDKLELLIKVDDEKEMSYLEERQALFVTVAWRSGCFSGNLPTELLGKAFARVQNQPKTGQGLNGSEMFRQASILNSEAKWGKHVDIPRKWRSFAQLCNEAHGMPRGIMSEQDMNARFPPDMRHECPPGSIFAYTQSLDLNQLILSTRRGRFGRKVIVIEFGDFVPEIIPGAINLERINHVRQNSPNSLFTLLALSITEDKHSMTRSGPPKEEVSWYDSAGEILGDGTPQPIEIELMLVETENGVSRRVGLAWAYLKSWINQNPQFRTFHLV